MMGWSEISIKPVSALPSEEGGMKNYSFEIWGIGESIADDSNSGSAENEKQTGLRQVAREADV